MNNTTLYYYIYKVGEPLYLMERNVLCDPETGKVFQPYIVDTNNAWCSNRADFVSIGPIDTSRFILFQHYPGNRINHDVLETLMEKRKLTATEKQRVRDAKKLFDDDPYHSLVQTWPFASPPHAAVASTTAKILSAWDALHDVMRGSGNCGGSYYVKAPDSFKEGSYDPRNPKRPSGLSGSPQVAGLITTEEAKINWSTHGANRKFRFDL